MNSTPARHLPKQRRARCLSHHRAGRGKLRRPRRRASATLRKPSIDPSMARLRRSNGLTINRLANARCREHVLPSAQSRLCRPGMLGHTSVKIYRPGRVSLLEVRFRSRTLAAGSRDSVDPDRSDERARCTGSDFQRDSGTTPPCSTAISTQLMVHRQSRRPQQLSSTGTTEQGSRVHQAKELDILGLPMDRNTLVFTKDDGSFLTARANYHAWSKLLTALPYPTSPLAISATSTPRCSARPGSQSPLLPHISGTPVQPRHRRSTRTSLAIVSRQGRCRSVTP